MDRTSAIPEESDTSPNQSKDRWAHALVKNVTAVTAAFKGAGDQRHAARRTYLSLAPEARTEGYLEVIDEVLYQSAALSRLTRNARMAVARRAHVIQFQPGEALCVQGTPQDALLVVISGEVEIVEGRPDAATTLPGGRLAPHPPQPPPPPPPQPPPPLPPHPFSRPPLSAQPSMSSQSGYAISTVSSPIGHQPATAPPTPAPALQLDNVHSVHPSLQPHSSMHRRHAHSHAMHRGGGQGAPVRSRSRHKVLDSGSAHAGASTTAAAGSGGAGLLATPRRTILRRGDSVGSVDMGWLSRLPLSPASVAAAMETAAVQLNSKAIMAARAEAGPSASPRVSSTGIQQLDEEGSVQRKSGGGDGAGGPSGTRGVISSGVEVGATQEPQQSDTTFPQLARDQPSSPQQQQQHWGRHSRDWIRDSWPGEESGGGFWGSGSSGGASSGSSGGGAADVEALQRLRWSCTAVAVNRVECAAIGLQQLAAVLSSECWDVEALVDGLEELPIFAALSRDQMRQLVRVVKMNVFTGGTVVYKQGTLGNDLYIIRSGCVRLLKQVAVDDNVRHRLNRISAELMSVRDQTAASAAALHNGGNVPAAFGSSAGFGYVPPPSRGSTPRLGSSQGQGQAQGALSWPALSPRPTSHGRNAPMTPVSPRGEVYTPTPLQGRHPAPAPASRPHTSISSTPISPSRATSGTGMLPVGPQAPTTPSVGSGATPTGSGRLPGVARRTNSQSFVEPRPGDVVLQDDIGRRHHSVTSLGNVGGNGGEAAAAAYADGHAQPLSPQHQNAGSQTPRQSAHFGSPCATGTAGIGAPGANRRSSHLRHHGRYCRRRSSHATADELLDRFGVVPRSLGEQPEAIYEEVVMPGIMLGLGALGLGGSGAGGGSDAASGGQSDQSGADSDGGVGGRGARVSATGSLPPVLGSPNHPSHAASPPGRAHASFCPNTRPMTSSAATASASAGTSSSGAATAAAAATIGAFGAGSSAAGNGPLPVWQARAPRQLASGQDLVFVEMGKLNAGQCFGEVRSDGVAVRSSSAVCDMRTEVLVISRNELAQRLGGQVFEYLWNQVPNEGTSPTLDPASEADQCTQQLERSMQWTLYKQKLVADVLAQKEERKRTALRCR